VIGLLSLSGKEARTSRVSAVLRHSRWDAVLVALALLHGLLLWIAPSIWLIAFGLWWNANTISHNFIHLPFFRSRAANALFSAYLSLLLGIPQTLWRDRHLAHHAEAAWRIRWSRRLVVESCLVAALWTVLLARVPQFFLTIYLPGYLLGLGLCHLQGHYEHMRGTPSTTATFRRTGREAFHRVSDGNLNFRTRRNASLPKCRCSVSFYGRLYNFLFFNDGYHVEHHAQPAVHWKRLPRLRQHHAAASRWPAVLRWLELVSLDSLERLVLKSKRLQCWVLRNHERAFRKVLLRLPAIRKVGIIGGGLFPRTALVLQRLIPEAQLLIIDASAANLQRALPFLAGNIQFAQQFYDSGCPDGFDADLDLLVVPLSFVGDREAIYRRPPAPHVLVHDWVWRRHDGGVVISLALLKRLNLISR